MPGKSVMKDSEELTQLKFSLLSLLRVMEEQKVLRSDEKVTCGTS